MITLFYCEIVMSSFFFIKLTLIRIFNLDYLAGVYMKEDATDKFAFDIDCIS
jgi:hypothetical protein